MNRYVAKGMNVSCRTINGEAFIFNHDSNLFLKLDGVGSFIWDQIIGAITICQISEICCRVFDGDKADINSSVFEFIEDLHTKGTVELSTQFLGEEVVSVC